MKKIISIIALVFTALTISAEENVYLESCTVQQGGTATIKLIVAHDASKGNIGTVQFNYSFPEGIEIAEEDVVGVGATTVNAVTKFVLLGGLESTTKADVNTAEVCVFNISVPSTMAVGEHAMSISNVQAVYEDGVTDFKLTEVESTITVQKEEVIEPMPEGYGIEIIPFTLSAGESKSINVYMKNALDVYNFDFTVTLPTGVTNQYTSGARGAKTYTKATIDNSNLYSATDETVTPLTLNQTVTNSGATIEYTLTNENNIDSYLPTTEIKPIMSIPVVGASTLTDGVYYLTITSSKINAVDYNNQIAEGEFATYTYEGGEYLASIFVGTPTETDPIVYGHYTTEGKKALTDAAGNMKFVDMLVATVDGDNPAVEDALVWGPANTSYTRTASTFSTVCVPFALTSGDNVTYYELTEATSTSLKFTETKTVAANTPAIFKGTVSASADGYVEANASSIKTVDAKNGLTLTGTYTSYELASGEGYYLSKGYFYGDGATVAPFRGYFAGSIAGVKTLSVLIEDASGIHDITSQLSNEDIYNLQGIRMQNTQKGVNIVGGKKVYIKK